MASAWNGSRRSYIIVVPFLSSELIPESGIGELLLRSMSVKLWGKCMVPLYLPCSFNNYMKLLGDIIRSFRDGAINMLMLLSTTSYH